MIRWKIPYRSKKNFRYQTSRTVRHNENYFRKNKKFFKWNKNYGLKRINYLFNKRFIQLNTWNWEIKYSCAKKVNNKQKY